MAEASDMTQGWHVGRQDGSSEWKGGPYSWAKLLAFAVEGRLTPDDLVWHPSMPEWVPAREIPGLFAAAPVASPDVPPGPAEEPAPAPPAPEPAPTAPEPAPAAEPPTSQAPVQQQPAAVPPVPPKRPRRGVIIGIAAALAIALLGGAGWYFTSGGGFAGLLGGGDGPDMGKATVKVADPSTHVQTEWGEAPPNQIGVVVAEGGKRADAEEVAKALGGTIVGELEFISMYQIEFPGSTAEDLVAALDTAKAGENIELAFPNGTAELRAEIWGVREDPYQDPLYGGGVGNGLVAMGVSQAWNYIRGSGVDLKDVHVGVVDNGLYAPGEGAESEFGGDVKINYPDGKENAVLSGPRTYDDGSTDPSGSHGTGVATIIGGDPNNGGPSGIAGPLGSKLTMSITNQRAGAYGVATSTPDPNDPTKVLWGNGVTYSLGNLVALKNQVAAGAKVINCSWGADVCHPDMASAYKKFFEKMAADNPDVIFVCAAGNTNKTALDNRTSFPCGHNLPNMITVGATDNDGKTASYSTIAGPNYVVDIAAPGTGAVVGIDANGGPVQQNGTSFASPEVAAAAAILKSLDPKLSAQQIKTILLATARTTIKTGDTEVAAEANVGGKVLAIDQAVLKVINEGRKAKGLPELTKEMLEQMGVIDAVAVTGGPGEYTVRGIVKAAGEKGTDVTIEVFGEDSAVGGKTTQEVGAKGGETKWSVTLPKDTGTIRVKRGDNGAASLITIERIDINGHWSGTFTVTDVTITDQKAAEEEGCAMVLLDAMKGKALPMTMDITVDESGQGNSVTFIDVSSLDPEGGTSSDPQTWGVSYSGNHIEFSPQDAQGVSSLNADVKRDGQNYVMTGTMTGGGKGWTMKAVFTLSKAAPQ